MFREGDKVMQVRNNYQIEWEICSKKGTLIDAGTGLYNGDMGIIRNINRFAEEMESRGIADAIRAEDGNERYEYFQPLNDPETVLLIDCWRDQESLDRHHASPMMAEIAKLREKYDLHMSVERYVSDTDGVPEKDRAFIRK